MTRSAWTRGKVGLRWGGTVVLVLTSCLQSGCRAEAPWPLWDAYAQKFLDNQGRVIDHTGNDHTTSEGQAYGMFFALVTGDRSRFDKLLAWTEKNLAHGDLTAWLPAWSWGKAPDGSWKVLDRNSASDADLWMAYALCEAGRLWKSPRYEKLGRLMAAHVAQQEVTMVSGVGTTLLPGAQGFHPDEQTWFLNPSYMPPPLLVYFAKRDPQGPWEQVLQTLPAVMHTEGGFAMDWMSAGSSGVRASVNPSKLVNGSSTETPIGSYDAIRTYLWIGMADPQVDAVKESLAELQGMAAYLHTHPFPPEQVDATGRVVSPNAPIGFSAAVIPFLRALGMTAQERAQADRLVALRDAKTGLYGREVAYYDQNLVMFSTGWTEQRFHFESDGRLRLRWK
jgi:endo-1,4-beta-D-glucanase Y